MTKTDSPKSLAVPRDSFSTSPSISLPSSSSSPSSPAVTCISPFSPAHFLSCKAILAVPTPLSPFNPLSSRAEVIEVCQEPNGLWKPCKPLTFGPGPEIPPK
ncbi:hypothetical protein K440DRAFT_247363 [Wilcoxina mikolae CBS 423.85]|nr:hypothetical protein K440DRAFT_247363 [Wilcoxina mikolae CBS 423.85]